MPPLGRSPDARSAGFLKNTVTFVPSRRFSLVEPLPRSQSAMCSSSKTIVLPRGLTWANPLGSTVPTRHTWAGNAVLMCSCRALGILAKAHSPLLTGRRALTVARRLPPVNGPCYPGDDDRPPPLDHVGHSRLHLRLRLRSSGGARRGGQGDHAGLRGQRHHRRAALRHVLLRLRRLHDPRRPPHRWPGSPARRVGGRGRHGVGSLAMGLAATPSVLFGGRFLVGLGAT